MHAYYRFGVEKLRYKYKATLRLPGFPSIGTSVHDSETQLPLRVIQVHICPCMKYACSMVGLT